MKPIFFLAPAALAAMAMPTAHAAVVDRPGATQTAAVDYFLKIDGVEGESSDSKHKGEIEILSYSWGASNSSSSGSAGGGGGAGKVSMQDFHFTAKSNKSSPKLFLSCATGEHIKKAVLTVRKAGKEQAEYIKIVFEDILVSSYQNGGDSTTAPTEQISLNFEKIQFSYAPRKADGSYGQPITTGWNVAENTPE
jgi:type VI secretion system secreted protein Hcp